jgi:uncharacterized glyoxalase superfamily protein PhnB
MLKAAIPEIHVTSSLAARDFYSTKLGFDCVSSWRPDETQADPCYMVFVRDGVRIHVTSFRDGALGTTLYVYVDDVDALFHELAAKGVQMPMAAPIDQSWGTREIAVRDADGNRIGFGQDMSRN